MPQWMQDLTAGWPMIRANLPTFFVILVLVIGAVWIVVNWSYNGLLASKNGQIELQDRQLADYKAKLEGATPDQAKARIDALEARLASVEPRRLTMPQRAGLIARLAPPAGELRAISITSEASGDSPQLGADFAYVFRAAGGWNIAEASAMGLGNRPHSGIAVQIPDLNNPSHAAKIVMNAFRSQNIRFDVQQAPNMPGMELSLLICTKIDR
jgi:hypothetical protein